MNKPTLIENTYYESDHTYLVTIGTDMGEFTGCAQCEPADYDYESRYFGWELAEIKANLQYARAKRKYYNAQLKSLTEFWREMSATRNYNVDAFWVKKIRAKVDDITFSRDWWNDRIKYLKETYHNKITVFDSSKPIKRKKVKND